MKRQCPKCGGPVKSNGTRKDKFGAKHTFIYCEKCGRMHVYLNEDGSCGREFERYNKKYSREDLEYQDACRKAVEEFRAQQNNMIKLNLRQKPKESSGILIKIDPIPEEEGLKIIKDYFQL